MGKRSFISNQNGVYQFIVDGKSFLALGGELHNSSASSISYMENKWENLVDMNLNTVIATASWELCEKQEGVFDFSLVTELINKAYQHKLKLIFIWFGTWKNGASTYVPEWVKTDVKRFPRIEKKGGIRTHTVTPFSENALEADSKAFDMFTKHITEVDLNNTVIAIQIQNEVGFLGGKRDYSSLAETSYKNGVPSDLINYLKNNKLFSGFCKDIVIKDDCDLSWDCVFDNNASEAFMAYYYATYIERMAKIGKKNVDIPMFANSWGLQFENDCPGDYPSGGPAETVLDIWKAAAPSLDFLSPDLYIEHTFKEECISYSKANNALFIPEARRDKYAPSWALYAFGFGALGFCPFGIDSLGTKSQLASDANVQAAAAFQDSENVPNMLSKVYKFLGSASEIITKARLTDGVHSVLKVNDNVETLIIGDYRFKFFLTSNINDNKCPSSAIIINSCENEFYIAGIGFNVKVLSKFENTFVELLSLEDGKFENGRFIADRRLNGDEQWAIGCSNDEFCVMKLRVHSFPEKE
jgi:hypothetical protein